MAAIALLVVLLAPPDATREWSKAHPVGLWIPPQWRVLERDREAKLFSVDGPRLGPGVPRLVLRHAGPASEPLRKMADRVSAEVRKRAGWVETSRTDRRVDPWPAVRFAFRFTEGGGEGRARATLVLLGAHYYVLELSAAASHFPAATYDQVEQSLDVRWATSRIGDLQLRLPVGWAVEEKEGRLSADAPALGPGRAVIFARRAGGPPAGVGRPGPEVRFLGEKRPTLVEARRQDDIDVQLLTLTAGGYSVALIAPEAAWGDLFPVLRQILADARALPGR